MNVKRLAIPEVTLVEPRIFADGRGFFFESFKAQEFWEMVAMDLNFVQENHSRSRQGVLRGLHYQLHPYAQGKLVRVVQGAIFDVAVDIRASSPTLGKWVAAELTADNHHQLWIPPGFAHGFLALSETADVIYKTTDYYAPAHERSIRWNDESLQIDWPQLGREPSLSQKDLNAISFPLAELFP